MNGSRTRWWSLVAVLGLVAAALAAPSGAAAQTATSGSSVSSTALGKLSADWWQWAFQRGPTNNPFTSTTAAACRQGQSGPVWFLVGTTNSTPVERDCTIPAGKQILVPIMNAECSDLEGNGTTKPALSACAADLMNKVTVVRASVDGAQVPGLTAPNDPQHRVQSSLFSFTAVQGNAFGVTPGTATKAVSDGWWILVQPLGVGAHTIAFHGEAPAFGFTVDVVYHITVR